MIPIPPPFVQQQASPFANIDWAENVVLKPISGSFRISDPNRR